MTNNNQNEPEEQREARIDAQIERDLAEISKDTKEIERLEEEKRHLHDHHPPKLVTVTVDGKPKEVAPGEYVVSNFKEKVGVPANYELEEVKDGRMIPLADDARIHIHGGEVFISHVKRGGSSHDE